MADSIKEAVRSVRIEGTIQIRGFGNLDRMASGKIPSLGGIKLYHVPEDVKGKGCSDSALKSDLMSWARYNRPPAHLFQISGDRDFATLLHQMKRFLNKACVIKNPDEDLTRDGKAYDPWSLATVDQVEELKAVMRVFPIWSTGIIMSISVSQSSLLVIQASAMNRHEIPPGSFNTFMVLSLTLCIALYDRVLVPLASKINGKPTRLSLKQRMGIGLLFSALSLPAIAIVESFRREMAIKEGSLDDPSAVVAMPAMWLLPYLVLSGIAEAFNAIGQNEFYYRELPKSMPSIATTFLGLAFSVGNLAAGIVMKTVDGFTGRGGESWVSSNINKGHYDYYYWVLASLSFANLVYYLVCSKAYGACRSESGIYVGPEEESED